MTGSPGRSTRPIATPRLSRQQAPPSGEATTETNAAVVRRLVEEVWGRDRSELIPALVADAYVGHLAIGDHYGPEGSGSRSPPTGRRSRT